jgi:hypothetical protein
MMITLVKMMFVVNNKIICYNQNMENHPGKQCNQSPYGSGLAN